MEKRNDILTELLQISNTVASVGNDNVYVLPDGYFDHFPETVLARVKTQMLLTSEKSNVYATPNGYFTNLAENILDQIKGQKEASNEVFNELETVAPTLNSINKANVYYLPQYYFEHLNINITNESPAKVVSISSRKKWLRYAVAAVFTGILATGGVRLLMNKKPLDITKEMAKSSDDEINQYLENEPSTGYAFINTASDEQENAGLFEGMTEEEIQQYLKEQPETAENSKKGI
jgi:hypothetical protein